MPPNSKSNLKKINLFFLKRTIEIFYFYFFNFILLIIISYIEILRYPTRYEPERCFWVDHFPHGDVDETRLQILQLQAFLAGTLGVLFSVSDSDDARYAHIVSVADDERDPMQGDQPV